MKTLHILFFLLCAVTVSAQSVTFLPNKCIIELKNTSFGLGHQGLGGVIYSEINGNSGGFRIDSNLPVNLAVNNGPAAIKIDSVTTMVNYTSLGVGAPLIKTKLLTGTTSANATLVNVPHGIANQKIIELKLMVFDGNKYVPQEFTSQAGRQASVFVNASNSVNNSALIRSKPFKVYVTYEL
jgi:hypothetical protein